MGKNYLLQKIINSLFQKVVEFRLLEVFKEVGTLLKDGRIGCCVELAQVKN